MPFNSIGDLASSFILNRGNFGAKRNLQKFSQELTTGVSSDLGAVLRDDFSNHVDWERKLSASKVLGKTIAESLIKVQAKQEVIGQLSDTALTLANSIQTTISSHSGGSVRTISLNAVSALEQVTSHLNTQVGGNNIFSFATNSLA